MKPSPRQDSATTHPLDEELIAHLFGDADDPTALEAAMADAPELRLRFDDLRRTLDLVDESPVPERAASYGAVVWQRLEGRLPAQTAPVLPSLRPTAARGVPRWMALAAAAVLLLGMGFLLGRLGSPATTSSDLSRPNARQPAQSSEQEPESPSSSALSDRGRERLLTAALSSHFGRSERLLAELSNASAEGPPDPALEQAWASELLTANRLYRLAAEGAGQKRIARLLAELEPVLLELAHGGTEPSAEEWNQLKRRVEERGLLFKVRITEDRLDPNRHDTTNPTPHRETI